MVNFGKFFDELSKLQQLQEYIYHMLLFNDTSQYSKVTYIGHMIQQEVLSIITIQ